MLDHVIQILMVPRVLDECARVGASFTTLRSVCRGARELVNSSLQGYTPCLGDKPQSDISGLALFEFLRSINLRHLSVLVHPTCTCLGWMHCNRTGRCSVACTAAGAYAFASGTHPYSAQLVHFISEIGAALAGVTHLHINLPWTKGCRNASVIAAAACVPLTPTFKLLLPLAPACARVRQLTIAGPVSPRLLSAFGSACPHLTALRATLTNLAASTIEQLGTLLPNLTSLVVQEADAAEVSQKQFPTYSDLDVTHDQRVRACCSALRGCPKLLALDMPAYDLTKEVWDELPQELLSCVGRRSVIGNGKLTNLTAAPMPSARAIQLHMGMRSLTLSECSVLQLRQLASFLVAAPNLLELATTKDKVLKVLIDPAVHNTSAQLCLLEARMSSGLVIGRKVATETGKHTAQLTLLVNLKPNSGSELNGILSASMPALPSIASLQLHGRKDYWVSPDKDDRLYVALSDVARVFPGLQEVRFSHVEVCAAGLLALATCSDLRSLTLEQCNDVTRDGLAALCAGSATLRQLACQSNWGIGSEDKRLMELPAWGGLVRVEVTLVFRWLAYKGD